MFHVFAQVTISLFLNIANRTYLHPIIWMFSRKFALHMNKQEIHAEIEKPLEISEGTIQGNEPLNSLPNWNYLAVIAFIAYADDRFGVLISADNLAKATTVSDLVQLIPEAGK